LMSLVTDRDFILSLLIVAAISLGSLYFFEDLFIVGLFIGLGLAMWVVWHLVGRGIAALITRRDVRRGDARLISPASYEPERLGIKGILKLSFYPNLFSFSLLSLAYQILGLEVGNPSELLDFMVNALFILPFTLFIPAIWIVENSGIVVVRPGEYPRPLSYLEIVGDFIDIGSMIGLVLTVGLALRASGSLLDAFGWIMAFLFIFFLMMFIPSLLATALYLRLSLLKAIQSFREGLLLHDVDLEVGYRCPNCRAAVSLGERFCPECGRSLME